jgi:hypothetical protein
MKWLLLVLALLGTLGIRAVSEPVQVVRGRVVDENGPVKDAVIRLKGTRFATRSDARGGFELEAKSQRITAWKDGYFIAGAPAGPGRIELKLRPLPREDHAGYQWVDPQPDSAHVHNCGNCHGEIFQEWRGSAHGRSGTNRRFLNLYDGSDWHGRAARGWNLLKEHPDGATVCAACHAPSVPFEHPGYDDFRKLDGVHARGVHCDYCHKIADTSTDRLGLEHGRFAHKLLRPAKGQLFFGPLDDVDRDEDSFSPLYRESRYCASCHEGVVFGTKVYTTYSEWLESPARKQGKQCQTCHMSPTGKLTNIAPGKGGIPRDPATLASHHMPGGDLAMSKRCLRLRVVLRHLEGAMQAEVEVRATNVGHRVPTGFIDRNLCLVLEALTADGKHVKPHDGFLLPEVAGVGDPARNNWSGLPGRYYARQLEDLKGRRPVPFWRPNREHADTRLIPERPDRTTWNFPAGAVAQVRVRLVQRRFLKVVADEKGWPDNEITVHDLRLEPPRPGKETSDER